MRTAGLKDRLETLEARRAEIDAKLDSPAPPAVRLHPNLAEIYRKKVAELAATLADPEIRAPALESIRSRITGVTVRDGLDGVTLDLEGALAAMLCLATSDKSPLGSGLDVGVLVVRLNWLRGQDLNL